jgi:mono/diheme cytochrome c family protein
LTLLSLAACPSSEVFDPMEVQPKALPYSESEYFDDRRAMRVPPANTIPREHFVADFRVVKGRIVPDGSFIERIPIPVTKQLIIDGRKNFEIVCATCHGLLGDGVSMVAENMALRPPPSLHDLADRRPGHFYETISIGFGMMPSYAAQLSVAERWGVVAYIRALIASQNAPVAAAPPDVRAKLTGVNP